MARRSRAREVVLQLLYEQDLNPAAGPDRWEPFLVQRIGDDAVRRFGRDLIAGVHSKRRELDRVISEVAEHWTLERMSPTDRNVLRIGAYEILFSDTPPKVAIDEAVELAKRYGTAQSSQFVNGILDRIMTMSRERENRETRDESRER